ncbi:glycosyltransferase involved in cell wall biosynthesis [Flavobacterium sp. 28A]|uniref:glycosyltransferase family 4 protein n=1 Tax=Flavobacterium sp. 28A TaxID=2735895 RepID=UPI00156D45CE|nr:glycosyltransferase family 4 protein [Flavobacterium sp. 28A]NRT15109.1 glycosyltransferase involved in cell wall biosynthesis [Flavobacterium sp. 28A]
MKILFFGLPIVSGNYTHFCYLREGIKNAQFTMMTLGEINTNIHYDPDFIQLGKGMDRNKQQKELVTLLLAYIEENKIDIVIPMNSPLVVSAIPFMPESVQVIQIVNSNTERVYQYILSHFNYVSKFICISPQQKKAVLSKSNLIVSRLEIVPHGVVLNEIISEESNSKTLVIGYLGRLNEGQKKISVILEVLKRIEFPFHFELIGDGVDGDAFIEALKKNKISFTNFGALPNAEINNLVLKWDIMIFPSVVEGFGLTLIETMNCGVVPIANLLPGITDYIITNDHDGFIVKENNINSYLKILNNLYNNPKRLMELKHNARDTVITRFNLTEICYRYQQIFNDVLLFKKPVALPFKDWHIYKEYKPSLLNRFVNKLK